MSEIAKLPRATAKDHPSLVFDSPQELLSQVILTRGEKRGALLRWRQDVLDELTAAGEGMHTRGISDRLPKLLKQIDDAVRELDANAADAPA